MIRVCVAGWTGGVVAAAIEAASDPQVVAGHRMIPPGLVRGLDLLLD